MNELQIFENKQFGQVRAIMKDGEPWFVAADVCKALEVGNPSQALTRLDDDEKFTTIISNDGAASGISSLAFVNEPGLYTLVLGSRKREAKSFKRWVTHDVVPSIRKTGAYMTPETIEKVLMNPDTIISLATQLKELQTKVEKDKPKVLFADAVAASHTSILIGDLAKLIRQNGVEVGQNRLFQWLRDNGYLIKRKGSDWNMPTQRSIEMGLLEIKESTHIDGNGCNVTTKTPKVTGKGQAYFVNKFLAKVS